MKFKSNYQENSITPSKVFFEKRETLKKIFLIGSSVLLPSNYGLAFANIINNVQKNENFINTGP